MTHVSVTLHPRYTLRNVDGGIVGVGTTRGIVRHLFAPAVPHLFIENAEMLQIVGRNTPPESIEVRNHDFDPDDVNVPNIRVDVELCVAPKDSAMRIDIRNRLNNVLRAWFENNGYTLSDFVVRVLWVPSNGLGDVNGVELDW